MLKGYATAKSVALVGTFNGWQTYDLLMHKTTQGWELPYTLGPGNYQYRFVVDGKWIEDPANPLFVYNQPHHVANAFLVIQPNYTFRLEGYSDARSVYLAGEFNDWSPNSLRMTREGNAWLCNVHLSVGKHLYKFIVDGHWIKDPANPLWEENEFGTDNSVIWMEEK
jgi:1,4-alpha-glucan branching enzyme